MRLLHGKPITVKRYTHNAHGELSLASEHVIIRCHIAIRTSDEPLDLRNDVVTTATLYSPYGSDIQDSDRIEDWDGLLWDVVGKPSNLKNPLTGWTPAQRATIRYVSG